MITLQNKTTLLFVILVTGSLIIFSCKKKKTNESLYKESSGDQLSYYKGKDTVYSAAGTSPHGNFKLKFNQTALSALGADGKLPTGQTFPEGSLIVKEVYSGGVKTLYVVMKKDPKSKFANNKWIWAEYKPDGEVVIGVNKDGKDCVSCHTSGNNRDLTLSFDLH